MSNIKIFHMVISKIKPSGEGLAVNRVPVALPADRLGLGGFKNMVSDEIEKSSFVMMFE